MNSHSTEGVVYKWEQLMNISRKLHPDLYPTNLKKRHCGCRAGAKRKERKRRFKRALPLIIMVNLKSLKNKMDELEALMRTNLEFEQCSINCLTEMWLQEHIPEPSISLPSFGCRAFIFALKAKRETEWHWPCRTDDCPYCIVCTDRTCPTHHHQT